MGKKLPATEGEVTPQTTAKFQESAAAMQQEDRTALAVSMCRTIDSWALAIFTLAGIIFGVIYSLVYGF